MFFLDIRPRRIFFICRLRSRVCLCRRIANSVVAFVVAVVVAPEAGAFDATSFCQPTFSRLRFRRVNIRARARASVANIRRNELRRTPNWRAILISNFDDNQPRRRECERHVGQTRIPADEYLCMDSEYPGYSRHPLYGLH